MLFIITAAVAAMVGGWPTLGPFLEIRAQWLMLITLTQGLRLSFACMTRPRSPPELVPGAMSHSAGQSPSSKKAPWLWHWALATMHLGTTRPEPWPQQIFAQLQSTTEFCLLAMALNLLLQLFQAPLRPLVVLQHPLREKGGFALMEVSTTL